jgi:hypothetical protein
MPANSIFSFTNTSIKIIKIAMSAILLMFFFYASPASAFEANAIWLKGEVRLDKYKHLDPGVNIEEFQIGPDETVTLYITYRSPARDEKKWSKVTYQLSLERPDGKPVEGLDHKEEIMGGSGFVPDEHSKDWGISHDSVIFSLSTEDARGIYLAKIFIKDHVSGEVITRSTKIHLKK